MKPILRNILAVMAGSLLGGMVNGFIIHISGDLIPPPEGANLLTEEGLKASMHLMQPIHFLMPFLAHAIGTLVGAYIAAYYAVSHAFKLAMVVAALFFSGGLMMVFMLPSPIWFTLLDLIVAYFPMGYLGWKLSDQFNFFSKIFPKSHD